MSCSSGFIAQNTNYNWESWSLALSYDPVTQITTGFICANEKINLPAVIETLKDQKSSAIHPILLPFTMFHMLLDSSVEHHHTLHKAIQDLEGTLNHEKKRSRDKTPSVEASLKDLEERDETLNYRDLSRQLNGCKKQQASRDGRGQFWRQFHNALVGAMKELKSSTYGNKTSVISTSHMELEHWISIVAAKFESLEGADMNYRVRIEAQLDLVRGTPQITCLLCLTSKCEALQSHGPEREKDPMQDRKVN